MYVTQPAIAMRGERLFPAAEWRETLILAVLALNRA